MFFRIFCEASPIVRPNQVWSTDITYVPLLCGFMYLTAVIDWYSRYVLSWRLSNSLEGAFCVEALEDALQQGKPEIFNTDQGSQYTAAAFTGRLEQAGVAISMDGRGRALDNVFIERLWRTVKYEWLYLHGYRSVPGAARRADFVLRLSTTSGRPHQSLAYRTPKEVYCEGTQQPMKKIGARRFWSRPEYRGAHICTHTGDELRRAARDFGEGLAGRSPSHLRNSSSLVQ